MISPGETMERVKVGKEKLLACLRDNYLRHKQELAKAWTAFRLKAAKLLADKAEQVRAGTLMDLDFPISPPDDHTDAYVRAITMLEMSEDESFVITATQFAAFVQDQWVWKAAFTSKNMTYVG